MADDKDTKKYPSSTSEVSKMLGINSAEHDLTLASFTGGNSGHGTPPNLPTEPEPSHAPSEHKTTRIEEKIKERHAASEPAAELETEDEKPAGAVVAVKIVKNVAPYAIVFAVGLFIYYFFFTGVNFGAIFDSRPKAITPKQTLLSQLQNEQLSNYQAWITGFYYDVNDPKIIDPEADNSGNGLTNFEKYLLNLNPKFYDTLGLGMADSEALAKGIDPHTGYPLSQAKKDIVEKYIDMEVVMNRLALNHLQNPSGSPQTVSPYFGLRGSVAGAQSNTDINNTESVSPFPNFLPQNIQSNQSTQFEPAQTGSNSGNIMGEGLDINMEIPGRLEIPSLKVNVPIMWSKTTKDFDKDLQSGVVHYPGTALPGQIGTTYIAGHSSNAPWAKGSFNQVFSKLGNLADNTSFKITVVQKNGKDAILHYVVSRRKEYSPTDQEQFRNAGTSTVALSTCWPVGSTAKRLVVFGELTQVEK